MVRSLLQGRDLSVLQRAQTFCEAGAALCSVDNPQVYSGKEVKLATLF